MTSKTVVYVPGVAGFGRQKVLGSVEYDSHDTSGLVRCDVPMFRGGPPSPEYSELEGIVTRLSGPRQNVVDSRLLKVRLCGQRNIWCPHRSSGYPPVGTLCTRSCGGLEGRVSEW
jgi:hypothetical protein